MPLLRPPAFADWATDDVNNGLGGAPNVQEPPLGRKQEGWNYGEKPPREFLNWILRTLNNWTKYLDENVTNLLAFQTKNNDADTYFRNQM